MTHKPPEEDFTDAALTVTEPKAFAAGIEFARAEGIVPPLQVLGGAPHLGEALEGIALIVNGVLVAVSGLTGVRVERASLVGESSSEMIGDTML